MQLGRRRHAKMGQLHPENWLKTSPGPSLDDGSINYDSVLLHREI